MVEKFIEYLRVEKRYSENTIISYQKDLRDFVSFLEETEGAGDTIRVDKKIIRNFLVELTQNNLSKRSINRKLSTLKSYYLFLLRIGEVAISPLESIQSLKFYPEKQRPMSLQEMDNVSDIMGEGTQLKSLIVEVLYQTGIRRAELCNLLLKNVDFGKNELKIIGKGNKIRVIPVSETLSNQLETYYLHERNPLPEALEYFFVTEKGKKLYEKYVYIVVNTYLSRVTLKDKRSPHILRHTFATHILSNGAEISKVKELLGHSSLSSTQVYTHTDIEKLKQVFGKAHPRAKEH